MFNHITVDSKTFERIYIYLQELNYVDLISHLKLIRNYCRKSMISKFPQDYDFVLLLFDCLSINDPEIVMIEALKLLKNLFIQQSFVEYFNNSASNKTLISKLSSLLLQQNYIQLNILVLEIFINFSGETINERNLALENLTFSNLFTILKNFDTDQKVKYYVSRLIHNYCRQLIEIETGIQIMDNYTEVWHMNISTDVKIELNWSIKHLSSSLKIDWIKTIKKNKMIDIFYEGLVYDNPNFAISSLYIIFQLIEEWCEPLTIELDYISGLLANPNNIDNISIGCYCVRHLIELLRSKTTIAKDFIEYGIFDQILNIYHTAPFECRMDAMSAFCSFAKSDLTEYFDIFYENNFIQIFLDFFFGEPINFELKLEMVKALSIIFEKARKRGIIDSVKREFLENGGVEIFESFDDDECDIDGKLATKADIFLSTYIDDDE